MEVRRFALAAGPFRLAVAANGTALVGVEGRDYLQQINLATGAVTDRTGRSGATCRPVPTTPAS